MGTRSKLDTRFGAYVIVSVSLWIFTMTLIGFGSPEWVRRTASNTWGLWELCANYQCKLFVDDGKPALFVASQAFGTVGICLATASLVSIISWMYMRHFHKLAICGFIGYMISACSLFICLLMFGLDHNETPNGNAFWLCLSGSTLMLVEGVLLLLGDHFWKQEDVPKIETTQITNPSPLPQFFPVALNPSNLMDQSFANSETHLVTSQDGATLPRVLGRRQQARESLRGTRPSSTTEDYYNLRYSAYEETANIQTVRDPTYLYNGQYAGSLSGSEVDSQLHFGMSNQGFC